MSVALYRKYRSKNLSEVVGQEHITRTLENAIKTGKISHAYLFTGPRGVGKTSVARILAHDINQLAYTDESIHLDIIEIDAASNRRIDEIRDLREKVHIAPTSAKYKIYIIDEVHMLTKEAFNALLKTLEEPPTHVIFILATTEIQKLPDTIVSRTQRFTFKSINEDVAVEHLRTIALHEGMHVEDDALKLLVSHSGGSFRDSINLLDQVGNSHNKITKADAEKLIGIASSEHISQLLETLDNGTAADILRHIDVLIEDGISPSQTAKQLASLIRSRIVLGNNNQKYLELLADLLKVQPSPEPEAQLEIALLKAQVPGQVNTTDVQKELVVETPKTVEMTSELVGETQKSDKALSELKIKKTNSNTSVATWWTDVLQTIKSRNNTLYGVLRMAEPEITADTLHLRFGFSFHKKKVDDTTTQVIIHDAIKNVTGISYKISTEHDETLPKKPITTKKADVITKPDRPDNEDMASITHIFGGGEVLES